MVQLNFRSISIMYAFFLRDIKVYASRLPIFILSFSVQYAVMYGLCFGYLLPKIGMGTNATMGVPVFLIGPILYALSVISFSTNAEFLLDFERDRLIDFQLTLVPPAYIIFEKILFNTIFNFISSSLYIPTLKLIFYNDLDLSRANWFGAYLILLLASFFVASMQMLLTCATQSRTSIRHFWRRINYPMVMLGGFLVPWTVMNAYSPKLGMLTLFNPILYITEGLRSALLDLPYFFSVSRCALALVVAGVLFSSLALLFFRRKADCV